MMLSRSLFSPIHTVSVALLAGGLGAQEAPSAQGLDDASIGNAIEMRLIRDEAISARDIDTTVMSGVVTLSGDVPSMLDEERALELAESMRGVRAVVDRLDVEPIIEWDDSAVKSMVEEALLRDPATEAYEIDVTCENGEVRLEGQVESWAEKTLCEDVAMGVQGVKSVDSAIVIRPSDRSDSDIAADVRRRLETDVYLEDDLIDVMVDDGMVSLTGTVGSATEKQRAKSWAWTTGVTNVDADGLRVRWWVDDDAQRDAPKAVVSDQKAASAVDDAMLFDPRVLSANVTVLVSDGVATLSGEVDNLPAKRAAEEDAMNTIGVWRVRNLLKVRTNPVPTDADIRAWIEDAFARSPYLDRLEITPLVIDGKVFLHGKADTMFEKEEAARVASNVTGVTEVVNRLDCTPYIVTPDELALRDEVEDELWWSPFVDADQVDVEVDGDTVTLTGHVDDWGEWRAASQNARDAGAVTVINRLKVGSTPGDSQH